jgi:hypothetical protein
MSLPKGLRGPPEFPRGWWLAGTGVMVIVMGVALALPWHEMRTVPDSVLPRPRFHPRAWGGSGCLGAGGYAEISVDLHGDAGVPPGRLEEWMRDETLSLYLRAHRAAPWSSVTRMLESVVHAGRRGIGLQVGPWHYLHMELVTDPLVPPDEEVTVAALPLADLDGTLAAAREREKARSRGPVIHLAFAGDPDVESVLHALECYAGDDASVRLAVVP